MQGRKENARTKRKMQWQHKKLFLESLWASGAIKKCNTAKSRGYQKYYEGIGSVQTVSDMYVGYQKIKKSEHWIVTGYRKYQEGILNIRRVLEM